MRVVGAFLDSLADGPAGCVLEGDAGIGKTALWREGVAAAQAASFRVLSCAPAESEAPLSYSSLTDLLAGVEPELFAALAAAAARRARGRAPAGRERRRRCRPARGRDGCGVGADRAGRADARRRRGRRRPVARLCLGAGARVRRQAARTAARRLPALAARAAARRRWASTDRWAARLERIRVGPLSAGALHQLIKARLGGTFSRAALLRDSSRDGRQPVLRARARVVAAAGRAARAGRAVSRSRRRPRARRAPAAEAAGDDAGRCCSSRRRCHARRSTRCGVRRRRLAEAAARPARARGGGRGDRGRRASRCASGIRCSPRRSTPPARTRSSGGRTGGWRRWLRMRSSGRGIWRSARRSRTRAVAHTAGEAAREVRRRGAPEAAVELAELAIRLTPASAADDRDRRTLELGHYLVEAGDPERARALVCAVADRPGLLRARALLDLAGLDYWGEGSLPARRTLRAGAVGCRGRPRPGGGLPCGAGGLLRLRRRPLRASRTDRARSARRGG